MLAFPMAYTRVLALRISIASKCMIQARFVCNDRVGVQIDAVKPRFRSPTSTLTCQTCACSFCAVDTLSLSSGYKLDKRCSIALGDRKYFSGQSAIKISDNVHPPSLLWDSEMRAVKHTPFKRIPQLMNRGEDSAECLPVFVTEQPRDVFKQKISRSPGLSHSHDFMKESTSGISEAESSAADRKRLAREAGTDKVDVGKFIGSDCSCIFTKIFTVRFV